MGNETFPCIPGRGRCSQAQLVCGTSCCLHSGDHNPTEPWPAHLYSHLCPVLGSNPAPHRGEVKETPVSSHSTLQPNTALR